jgi:biopolymer transport protein ExbD
MRLTKRHQRGGLEMNMTPMIDVTFLLLIFFMTVNQVSKANRAEVQLPPAKGSQDQSEDPLVVNVNIDGEIIVTGATIGLPQLVTLVTSEISKADNDPARVKVVLRADRRGNCRTVNEVVKLLERLGVHSVRLAVESGR